MERIGYKYLDIIDLLTNTGLKKDLLFFDKILIEKDILKVQLIVFEACYKAGIINSKSYVENLEHNMNDIRFLTKKGIIRLIESPRTLNYMNPAFVYRAYKGLFDMEKPGGVIGVSSYADLLRHFFDFKSRVICNEYYKKGKPEYMPILSDSEFVVPEITFDSELVKTKENNVLNIVLHKFPLPDDSIPWEGILDFKSKKKIQDSLRRLRVWLSNRGSDARHEKKIEEDFEKLKNDYEERMKLEMKKFKLGTLVTVTTATVEVLQSILKWSIPNIGKRLIEVKKAHVELLIGETKAPGREIAYICKVEEQFSKSA